MSDDEKVAGRAPAGMIFINSLELLKFKKNNMSKVQLEKIWLFLSLSLSFVF